MTFWQLLAATWSWDPSVIAGCLMLAAVYLLAVKFRVNRHNGWFLSGLLVMYLALESPLEEFGDTYLFSAHMAQHLLLVLVVPPLLLWGIPPRLARQLINGSPAGAAERLLRRAPVAWLLAGVTLWVWHLPTLYNATLLDERLHIFEHLTFLVTATIFWWPVLTPLPESRLDPLASIFYLFAAAASNAALGIILTFAEPGLYPAYIHPHDELGILPALRNQWGLTLAVDQQVGGLLMWVPGSLVYLAGIVAALVYWYGAPEDDPPRQPASTVSAPS